MRQRLTGVTPRCCRSGRWDCLASPSHYGDQPSLSRSETRTLSGDEVKHIMAATDADSPGTHTAGR